MGFDIVLTAKLKESRIPTNVIASKNSAEPESLECGLELEKHVLVGMLTIVEENVYFANRCEQFGELHT